MYCCVKRVTGELNTCLGAVLVIRCLLVPRAVLEVILERQPIYNDNDWLGKLSWFLNYFN